MKKASVILNIVLFVAIGTLYYLHFAGLKQNSQTASSENVLGKANEASAMNTGKYKMAYVNSDTLLEHYEYYLKIKKEAEDKRAILDAELKRRSTVIEQEYLNAQQKAQAGKMNVNEMQAVEEKLYKKQQELMGYKDSNTQILMQEEQKITEELFSKITDYLKAYQNTTGYKVVFGYTKGGGILYIDDALDITREVIDGLNKEYQSAGTK